jgi:hypothetical protein
MFEKIIFACYSVICKFTDIAVAAKKTAKTLNILHLIALGC